MTHCHHDHSHHSPSTFNKAFLIAIAANGLFVICQIFFAHIANSTSLLADAVHNMGDVFSLVVAWIGNRLLQREPTDSSTYGMKKASILAALTNVLLLVFTCGIIATEAVYKLFVPAVVDTNAVMIVATVGIIVNAATAALFFKGGHDLNIRAAFLHLVYDALVSLGVVLSAALLHYTGWLWLDPCVGLLIALVILKGSWSLFRDSMRLILDGVPRHISVAKVRTFLESLEGVSGVHDLHIWALSTQENALSVHLWMPEHTLTDENRHTIGKILHKEYNIHHVTIQVERLQEFCIDHCKPFL